MASLLVAGVQARDPKPGFSCSGCKIAFLDASQRKDHYAGEWHRHNLKRKAAGLPPVAEEAFNQRLAALKQSNPSKSDVVAECVMCHKQFSSESAHQHHLGSKMHLEKAQKQSASAAGSRSDSIASKDTHMSDGGISTNERHAVLRNAEMSPEELIEWKIRTAVKLNVTDCLFCRSSFPDIPANVKHMQSTHSFFIPYLEHVTDMEGLLGYLGEKVAVGNFCLSCGENGKMFYSLEAVRQHMNERGHCKMLFDGCEDEYAPFYDYGQDDEDDWEEVTAEEAAELEGKVSSRSTPGAADDDDDDDDDEDVAPFQPAVRFPKLAKGSEPQEIVFTDESGRVKVVGHRGLKKFYRQSPKPVDEREQAIVALITADYQSLGVKTRRGPGSALILHPMAGRGRVAPFEKKSKDFHFTARMRLKVGVRANKLFTCYTAMNTFG